MRKALRVGRLLFLPVMQQS